VTAQMGHLFYRNLESLCLPADMLSSFTRDAAVCLHSTVVLLHRLSTSGDWWQVARARHPLMLIQVLWEFLNVSRPACLHMLGSWLWGSLSSS
jgi:hypothetical protein